MTSILVVDDDEDIRALVGELLERAGHGVIKAPDGESALKLFYSRKPDLVVLDVSMPGLDGWEVLNRIRELSDVPVLMLTATPELIYGRDLASHYQAQGLKLSKHFK